MAKNMKYVSGLLNDAIHANFGQLSATTPLHSLVLVLARC